MTNADNVNNIVLFEPPRGRRVMRIERNEDGTYIPVEVPALFVELRLGDDFSIEMRLHDRTGVVGTLEYGLTVKSPEDFDLDVLRAAWERWREDSEVVA
jgi:hypothetical protein